MKIDYDGIMIIDHWTTSFGEMTLSNYDSNENADYEPSEFEDSDEQTHPDIISVIGPVLMQIPRKFYYR